MTLGIILGIELTPARESAAILIMAASTRAGQSWDLRLPCASLRVYASNTPQEAAILIWGALPHKCAVPASLGTPHLCGSEASKRELPGSESQNENCCRFARGREFDTQDYTERHKSLRRVWARGLQGLVGRVPSRGVISVVAYSEPKWVICWIKPRNRVQ